MDGPKTLRIFPIRASFQQPQHLLYIRLRDEAQSSHVLEDIYPSFFLQTNTATSLSLSNSRCYQNISYSLYTWSLHTCSKQRAGQTRAIGIHKQILCLPDRRSPLMIEAQQSVVTAPGLNSNLLIVLQLQRLHSPTPPRGTGGCSSTSALHSWALPPRVSPHFLSLPTVKQPHQKTFSATTSQTF